MTAKARKTEARYLRRVMSLRDLVVYGVIIIQVVAPLPVFGLLEQRSNNHAALTALIAFIPMFCTALSYGRMALLYPSAGSAYSYVGGTFNPYSGFLIGWSMLLDYWMMVVMSLLIPALAIQRVLPASPLFLITLVVVVSMTAFNLRGIRATTLASGVLLLLSSVAITAFIGLAVAHMVFGAGWGSVLSVSRLYDPAQFRAGAVLSGISLAALTYIGFDGVTTLAEDSLEPKRHIVLATVLVATIIGALSIIELYFLHSILPEWRTTDVNTSYLDAMRIVGGPVLFTTFLVLMSVSQFGCGLAMQVSVSRLLYGMGRDQALPSALFGYLSPRSGNPLRNILLVGALGYLGACFIAFDQVLDLLNFGAFIGFMGVNAATVWSYYVKPQKARRRNIALDLALPTVGFAGCLIFWVGLPAHAKFLGGTWLIAGLAYCAYKTRGFRERPVSFNFQQ